MKNAAYLTFALFLLLLPLVAAEAPTLLYDFNTNFTSTTPGYVKMHELDDTHLAILSVDGTTTKFRIINPATGAITDTADIGGANRVVGIDHTGTTIAVCAYDRVSPGFGEVVRFYRKPSGQDGFLNLLGAEYYSSSDSGYSGCVIDETSSTRGKLFVQNFGKTFIQPDKDARIIVYFNGSARELEQLPINYGNIQAFERTYDEENEVFQNGGDFISNEDPENHTGKTLDSLILGDYVVAWNHDSSNPEYITNDGHLVLAEDYNDLIESSGSATMDKIVALPNRNNVLGIINGTWYSADFSTPATPVLTDEGVTLPEFTDSYNNFLTTSTRIYHFNESSGRLTTWQYSTGPTCLASEGCYIDDAFSYGDSVLNHGWSGTGVSPVDGQLECYQNPGRYHRYYFTPITQSTGTFYLDFDATMCGSSTSELYLSLYSSNDLAWNIRMKADFLGGTIQDHQSNYLAYSIGDNVTDTEGWCSGLQRFENSYKVIFYPQNTPKTYDIYINDAVVSEGNEWTTIGQNLLSVDNFDIGVSPTTPYCWWRLDNVQLYTIPLDQQLTDEQIEDARNTIGGIEMSLDTQFHFDRDDHCEVTENTQICFLRWAVGGILDWLWRIIINNPLQSLAFILVAIVLVVAGYNSRR